MPEPRTRTARALTKAPRLEHIHPQNLAAGLVGDLGPNAAVDALRFEDLSLEILPLDYATVSESTMTGVVADEVHMRGVRVVDSVLAGFNVPVLRSPRSTWRDVVLKDSRIGSAEFYESGMRALAFENCKLGYVNLRGSSLSDVRFTNCTIDELDLGGATAERVAFESCGIRALDVQKATVADFDLRGADVQHVAGIRNLAGATISALQLAMLAPVIASSLGILVEE